MRNTQFFWGMADRSLFSVIFLLWGPSDLFGEIASMYRIVYLFGKQMVTSVMFAYGEILPYTGQFFYILDGPITLYWATMFLFFEMA